VAGAACRQRRRRRRRGAAAALKVGAGTGGGRRTSGGGRAAACIAAACGIWARPLRHRRHDGSACPRRRRAGRGGAAHGGYKVRRSCEVQAVQASGISRLQLRSGWPVQCQASQSGMCRRDGVAGREVQAARHAPRTPRVRRSPHAACCSRLVPIPSPPRGLPVCAAAASCAAGASTAHARSLTARARLPGLRPGGGAVRATRLSCASFHAAGRCSDAALQI
jgi:hypothetical protein